MPLLLLSRGQDNPEDHEEQCRNQDKCFQPGRRGRIVCAKHNEHDKENDGYQAGAAAGIFPLFVFRFLKLGLAGFLRPSRFLKALLLFRAQPCLGFGPSFLMNH